MYQQAYLVTNFKSQKCKSTPTHKSSLLSVCTTQQTQSGCREWSVGHGWKMSSTHSSKSYVPFMLLWAALYPGLENALRECSFTLPISSATELPSWKGEISDCSPPPPPPPPTYPASSTHVQTTAARHPTLYTLLSCWQGVSCRCLSPPPPTPTLFPHHSSLVVTSPRPSCACQTHPHLQCRTPRHTSNDTKTTQEGVT